MDEKQLIKYDKNFSEYPLWFQDKKNTVHFKWVDIEGFTYEAAYKAPVRADYLFLLFFLLKSQKRGWVDKISLVRSEVIKGCGLQRTKTAYERLEESLKRWQRVNISFSGIFYDNKKYKSIEFGIIDSWQIEDGDKKRQTGHLEIVLNPMWLLHQKHSKFFQMLNFEELKNLKDPLATRLYELLIKQFHNRNRWQIDAIKLAAKIPIKEKYPAHIVPKIKSAIARISKNTELKIKLTVDRQRGKATFFFLRITNEETDIENAIPDHILKNIPEKERDSCIDICKKILRERVDGEECLGWLIGYVNIKDYENYGAYLRFVYDKKLYEQHLEQKRIDEEFIAEQKAKAEAQKKAQIEQETAIGQKESEELYLNSLIESLSSENEEELNQLAAKMLEEEALASGKRFSLTKYRTFIRSNNKSRAIKYLYPYRIKLIKKFMKEKNL